MAQGTTYNYDPLQVIFNVNGQDVVGFAKGTFIKVTRNVEAFTLVVGSDGEATRVKSTNLSGKITCTLQQSSPSNDQFSSLATTDENTSQGACSVTLKDQNGTTTVTVLSAWVQKKPDTEFSDENTNREWVFETGSLKMDVGGQTKITL